MPGWNGKRIASLGLACGLAMLGGALQVGCHKGSKADNSLQAPVLSYDHGDAGHPEPALHQRHAHRPGP
jgi:hypothetical protein